MSRRLIIMLVVLQFGAFSSQDARSQPPISCPVDDDEPIARVRYFIANTEGGGVRIDWETHSERRSESCHVARASSPDGPFGPVSPEIPSAGTDSTGSAYSVFDPTGTPAHFYWLMETETTGEQMNATTVVSVDEVPLPLLPPDGVPIVAGENPNYPDNAQTIPDALIICPDEWVDEIEPLRNHWNSFRHHVTVVAPLSQTGATTTSIKAFIAAFGPSYLLLVGDASLSVPAHDIIPTFTTWDAEMNEVMVTDAPYGDFDADGFSDIALGRWPVLTSAEAAICVEKSIAYDYQLPGQEWRTRWQTLVMDRNINGYSGAGARELANRLVSDLPAFTEVSQLRALEVPCEQQACNAARQAAAINALNQGAHLFISFGTTSHETDLVKFLNTWGVSFDFDQLYATQRYAFYLGASCEMGGFTYESTERPWVEQFMILEEKGAIAWFGPSDNTYQLENYFIGKEILLRLSHDSPTSLATICKDAIQTIRATYGTHGRFTSYGFFGDPTLVLAWDEYDPPTDAAAVSSSAPLRLLSYMAPDRAHSKLLYVVPTRNRLSLRIYDVAGRLVRTLFDERLVNVGRYQVNWDGRDERGRQVSSSIYFSHLTSNEESASAKIVVIR